MGFHNGPYVELRSAAYRLRRAYAALRSAYASLRGNTPMDAKGYARWTQRKLNAVCMPTQQHATQRQIICAYVRNPTHGVQ